MPGFDASAQERLAEALKAEAERLGFDGCGISVAERLEDDARRLERWLTEGRHGSMAWMANHFDKRVDPRELVPGARSVISVVQSYYQPVVAGWDAPPSGTGIDAPGKVSRYAWGDDYHLVMKERLWALYNWLDEACGGIAGRAFVDSAPVLDRAWAARSGLGWVGKSTMLLSRDLGTYFFIGELIVDVPLPPDGPTPDFCGRCTACIDACPTDAIFEPYAVDSNRCISYQTIENRTATIPEPVQAHLEGWVFGCDICQDVCPWNKFKQPTREPRYLPREGVTDTTLREWVELDLEAFRQRFRKTPVKRAKFEGFQRNVRAALEAELNRDRRGP